MLELNLQYRLDAIGFCVLVVAGALCVHLWLRRSHGQAFPKWALSVLGFLLIGGTLLPELAQERERGRLRDMLAGIAPTYAQELQLLGHEHLTFQTSDSDPIYQKMIEAQIRWEKINPNVSDIYTFRKLSDGKVGFVVDSETDYDRNGLSSTVGSEAWNSRDLKSRPH